MAHPDCTTSEQHPVRINFFARHTAIVDGCRKTYLLFSASWFKPHRDKDILGKPVTVWECDIFEISGVDCFCFCPCNLPQKELFHWLMISTQMSLLCLSRNSFSAHMIITVTVMYLCIMYIITLLFSIHDIYTLLLYNIVLL